MESSVHQDGVSCAGLPEDALSLARYLDRMRGAYPYGIPRALLVARARAAQAAAVEHPSVGSSASAAHGAPARQPSSVQVTFILVGGADPLPPEQVELLKAITEKGLRIPTTHSTSHRVASPAEVSERVAALMSSERPRLVVVLGDLTCDGRQWEREGTVVLHSHPLHRIQDDAGVKREFWGHLRSVLGVLSA